MVTLAMVPLKAQPPGFVDRVYASGFNQAIGLTFDELGRMYVWERGGRVFIVEDGLKTSTPLLDLSDEVGGWRDFGLLSVVLDPDFLSNGHIYLLYTVDFNHFDLGNTARDAYFAAYGRITRYTVTNPSAVIDVMAVDPASRQVLLGETPQTGFPCTHQSHHVGFLQFGADGTLLATCGDAASYSTTDEGGVIGGGWVNECIQHGILDTTSGRNENIGAYRSQAPYSLNGKMVRIDPSTGNGLPSNPLYNASQPRSQESRLWARGLRNPCRMVYKPGTGSANPALGDPGTFFIGDVGWNKREEFSICDGPNMNFGWPWYEGFSLEGNYTNPNFQPGTNGIPAHDPPAFDWRNGRTARVMRNGTVYNMGAGGNPVAGNNFNGNCSIGGVWYEGTDFPPEYRNSYYQADYGTGWIQQFIFDTNNQPLEVKSFLPNGGAVTGLGTSPTTGSIYYVNFGSVVRKISYVGTNLPPTAVIKADQTTGQDGLSVAFRGNRSSDPEGDPLTYTWDFGDGSVSNAVNPSHTFTSGAGVPMKFVVKLTVDDGNGFPDTDSLVISLNNTAPVILSTSIDSKHYYSGTETVNLSAIVTDAEDNPADLRVEWQTFLYHDNHNHAEPIAQVASTTTVLSPVGCDGILYFYRIRLKVTDSGGLSSIFEKDIYPDCGGSGSNPVARFNFEEISQKPFKYSFDAIASYDLDGPLLSYLWDFGDGMTSDKINPTHVFFEEGSYTITLTVTDQDGNTNSTNSVVSILCSSASYGTPTGEVEYERWNGVGGTSLSSIDFENDLPSSVTALTRTETQTNVADNYGGRIRGYLFPPQTGTYNFWIASDDNGELFVSTDDNPSNMASIASVPGWTNSRQWTKYAEQQGSINLVAGQRYYFEARFKEGGGGDNLAVRWQLPDGTMEEPIGANRIAPYNGGAYPILWREEFHLPDGLTTDNGGTKWIADATNLGGNAVYRISGQSIAGTNLDGEAIWTSDTVYIGSEAEVSVSFDHRGDGTFESPDYFRVYYKLDGGPEQLLLDRTGASMPASTTTFTSGAISGNTLQLLVRMRNSTNSETYVLDNVTFSSNGSLNGGGSAQCASCISTPASRIALRGQYGSCVSEFNNAYLEIQDQYEEALLAIHDNNQDLGLVTVETFDHGNDPFVFGDFFYLTRSFEITAENTFASSVRVKFYLLPSEFAALQAAAPTVSDLNDVVLEKYSNGKLGEAGTGSLSIISPVSTSMGTGPDGSHELVYDVPSFSTFFIRAAQTTFPVEWLDFRVAAEGLHAALEWEVAQDGKGSHFEIERSANGSDYKQIATVVMEKAEKPSNRYTHLDKNIADLGVATLYYRIRQYDFNGQETLGPTRILALDLSRQLRVSVYPNPATEGFTLRYFLPENTSATYEILDIMGKTVDEGILEKQEGSSKKHIQSADWARGVYFVKVRHALGSITQKFILE